MLAALRERHELRGRAGPPPAGLVQAIDGFRVELAEVRVRLSRAGAHQPAGESGAHRGTTGSRA